MSTSSNPVSDGLKNRARMTGVTSAEKCGDGSGSVRIISELEGEHAEFILSHRNARSLFAMLGSHLGLLDTEPCKPEVASCQKEIPNSIFELASIRLLVDTVKAAVSV